MLQLHSSDSLYTVGAAEGYSIIIWTKTEITAGTNSHVTGTERLLRYNEVN